ncbi:hypothetical protein PACTADRAFT_78535 [Pachysolen tannophilus NRRL Y-2460]|uniref:Uncharacterized protein n=1 Tax=Pachysolen tannophilus NRRL Y-2460 TaxID=669874 RepID=A0A1E4U2J3_PACTA|nr:hypothetical protein PACTADRAFT_78535 [Pachysolen tannophilus NRRL Y-2460]
MSEEEVKDKSVEPVASVDSTEESGESQLSKEERLEQARKKFEELKKKKNKKKKNKKKSKEEEAKAEEELKEAEAELEAEKEEEEETEEKEEEQTEEATEKKDDGIEPETKTLNWAEEIQKAPASDNSSHNSDHNSGHENDNGDDELKETVKNQEQEISKLKKETTDLKLERIQLLEKIESLELTVKKLNRSLQFSKTDQPNVYQSDYNSDLSLSPDNFDPMSSGIADTGTRPPSFVKTPSFQNINMPMQADEVVDMRERLMKWKNWQIDMTHWRTIGSGPILEF